MPGAGTGIIAIRSDVLDRWIQIGIASGRVISLTFPEARPAATIDTHPLADRFVAYVDEGAEDAFQDVPVALTVPTDPRRIYETLRAIGYGRDVSLDEIAGAAPIDATDDEATALVRDALRTNPIPVIIPDHRVRDAVGGTPAEVRDALRRIEGLA